MTCRYLTFAMLLATVALAPPLMAANEPVMPQTHVADFDPSNPNNRSIGELSYRGGLEIEPGEAEIGHISGLDWSDGKLYAVTNDGRWMILTTDAFRDQLTDVIEVEFGPLLDQKGKKLRSREEQQAQSISRGASGELLVAFASDGHVWRYSDLDGAAEPTELSVEDLTGFDRRYVADVPPDSESLAADCASNGVCFLLFRDRSPEGSHGATIVAIGPDGKQEKLADLPTTKLQSLTVREQGQKTYLYLASNSDPSKGEWARLMKFEVSHRAATQPGVPEKVYATTSVVLDTAMGEITIALETERAPITAANFLRYVDEGRFAGIKCYRAMKHRELNVPSGFLQCGTQGDPQRTLPPIVHEATSETGLSHTNGALSMARFEPGTANGDFSIMIRDQTGLDAQPDSEDPELRPGFAVFGYVTNGMDVVHAIHAAPTDPDAGEGFMKGQLLAQPITILGARRAAGGE